MAEFTFVDIDNNRFSRDRSPDWCSICHHACEPREVDWKLTGSSSRRPDLEIVYQCPRRACGRLFIARYQADWKRTHGPSGLREEYFRFVGLVPKAPQDTDFPKEVADISPSFVSIFNEANAAESHTLAQVAGAGYRKSLEYLIKDYCSAMDPAKAEEIKRKFLGRCVQDHVTDERVRECARRATWLGNDEVHYLRRWESKDLEDLKVLIQLTVGWIHSDALTKRYLSDMQ